MAKKGLFFVDLLAVLTVNLFVESFYGIKQLSFNFTIFFPPRFVSIDYSPLFYYKRASEVCYVRLAYA